jgi:hypothetical protein
MNYFNSSRKNITYILNGTWKSVITSDWLLCLVWPRCNEWKIQKSWHPFTWHFYRAMKRDPCITLTCNEIKSSAFRGLWLKTLTCNETKSSAFCGIWLETLMCNETKSSAFRGLWLETLTCNETKSSAFNGLWLETLMCNETKILSLPWYVTGNTYM